MQMALLGYFWVLGGYGPHVVAAYTVGMACSDRDSDPTRSGCSPRSPGDHLGRAAYTLARFTRGRWAASLRAAT